MGSERRRNGGEDAARAWEQSTAGNDDAKRVRVYEEVNKRMPHADVCLRSKGGGSSKVAGHIGRGEGGCDTGADSGRE